MYLLKILLTTSICFSIYYLVYISYQNRLSSATFYGVYLILCPKEIFKNEIANPREVS